MKEFMAVPLEEAPQEVKDLDLQIKDVSVYLQLVAQGQYPGAHSEFVSKLKGFLISIRDQLITAYDSTEYVLKQRLPVEETTADPAE